MGIQHALLHSPVATSKALATSIRELLAGLQEQGHLRPGKDICARKNVHLGVGGQRQEVQRTRG